MTLTLDEYQAQAGTTAIYPRVFTEEQVRNIVLRVMHYMIEDIETVAYINNQTDEAMALEETAFNRLVYPILGLVGEAGELANKLKKVTRDDGGAMKANRAADMAAESGDVLWYLAAVTGELDMSLDTVGQLNLDKLADRQARGVVSGDGDNR